MHSQCTGARNVDNIGTDSSTARMVSEIYVYTRRNMNVYIHRSMLAILSARARRACHLCESRRNMRLFLVVEHLSREKVSAKETLSYRDGGDLNLNPSSRN